jgi:hypothetical protein
MGAGGEVYFEGTLEEGEEELVVIFVVLKSFVLQQVRSCHEVRKAFLQPQIVPPLHSYEITKPHMRQLMKRHVVQSAIHTHFRNNHILGLRIHRLQPILRKCHRRQILFRSDSQLWTEDLIILAPRILDACVFLIESNSFINHHE